jgi:hypothetical protein
LATGDHAAARVEAVAGDRLAPLHHVGGATGGGIQPEQQRVTQRGPADRPAVQGRVGGVLVVDHGEGLELLVTEPHHVESGHARAHQLIPVGAGQAGPQRLQAVRVEVDPVARGLVGRGRPALEHLHVQAGLAEPVSQAQTSQTRAGDNDLHLLPLFSW